MATTKQKVVLTGTTFLGSWMALGHNGLSGLVAACIAYGVASYADDILDKAAATFRGSSQQGDNRITPDDIAAYKRLKSQGNTISFANESDFTVPKSLDRDTTFVFSDVLVLDRFVPSAERIYIGTLPDGTNLFCPIEALCHVALAGSTDGGKTNIMRMILAQLCAIGVQVCMLNPHWTNYDVAKDQDWTPFVPHLLYDPMKYMLLPSEAEKYAKIEYFLKDAAERIIPARLRKFARSQSVGEPIFYVIDELPAIVKHVKNAPEYLGTILREGRKLEIFLISASQDFLLDTIGGSGEVRDCYRTAFSVGAGDTTTKKLLGPKLPELSQPLGKGIALLRNASTKQVIEAKVVYIPLVDNEAVRHLLGPTTYVQNDETVTEQLDSEPEDAEQQSQWNQRATHTTRSPAPSAPAVESGPETASVSPNIEKWLKSDDLHIDTLVQAWNAGINTVAAIQSFFHMKQGEAYKAYKRVRDLKTDPVQDQKADQEADSEPTDS